MARYKHTDAEDGQGLFLSIQLKEQLIPGSFPYMLNEIIDTEIDLSNFDNNYKNDKTGATAIPPAALMKLIIYGYSHGRRSSRDIGDLAKYNIIAKALTNNLEPHWTTIADFISGNSAGFRKTFTEVLAYCHELGLISGETFAVDGLRLPSNASAELSGTKEELGKRLEIYKRMAAKHIARHERRDRAGEVDERAERNYEKRQRKLERGIAKIRIFLEETEGKKGSCGQEIKSNVTDNESGLIRTSKGYIQGYIGIAVSDCKNQVIVGAEAVGSSNENEHFPGIIRETKANMEGLKKERVTETKTKEGSLERNEAETKPVILADNNYWGERNLRAAAEAGMEMIMPDSHYRRRLKGKEERRYEAWDFRYHEEGAYYECPNGVHLGYKGEKKLQGKEYKWYEATAQDCLKCPDYGRCIKSSRGKKRRGRSLLIGYGEGHLCNELKKKLEREEYQEKYGERIGIIEPVFADIRYCKRLDRFTLRGKEKVNGQWLLYCIVHNLGKCLQVYREGKR